ncbi:MAG: DUF167 family protein [Pseudomonadales bacterium]
MSVRDAGSESPSAPPCRWDGTDLVLELRVVPRASRDAVVRDGDQLKVRITAPPVDGKANQHLRRLLGRLLGVAQSQVVIERGEHDRSKRVRVHGPRLQPDFVPPR